MSVRSVPMHSRTIVSPTRSVTSIRTSPSCSSQGKWTGVRAHSRSARRPLRSVGAATYDVQPSLTCAYYTYWSGVAAEGVELYPRPGRMIVAAPTNDGHLLPPVRRRVGLVGDAGYHKDLILALGITDASRDAEPLADAVHAGVLWPPTAGIGAGRVSATDQPLLRHLRRNCRGR